MKNGVGVSFGFSLPSSWKKPMPTLTLTPIKMEVLYEDNHIIVVNKQAGEIVQGDKTGDTPLSDMVKQYIKEAYAKPGAVFLGVVHRLDRPVSGIVVFARTSKALARLNQMFRTNQVRKTYWAIVPSSPLCQPTHLEHYLLRNEKQNKSYAYDNEKPNTKKASLDFRPIASNDHYTLIEVDLHTGRHHQIRCQLAHIGLPIRGDLKYGAKRSNPDGSISLCAHAIDFIHPVTKAPIHIEAPLPADPIWSTFSIQS